MPLNTKIIINTINKYEKREDTDSLHSYSQIKDLALITDFQVSQFVNNEDLKLHYFSLICFLFIKFILVEFLMLMLLQTLKSQ